MSQSTASSTPSASNTASQTYGPHPLPWPRYQPPTRTPQSTTKAISSSLFRTRSQSHSAPRWDPISTFRTRLSGSISGPSLSSQNSQPISLQRLSSSPTRRYSSATIPAQHIFPEASSLASTSIPDRDHYTIPPSSGIIPLDSTSSTCSTTQVESPPSSSWAVDPGNATPTSGCILIPTDEQQPRTIPDFGDISLPTPLSLADVSFFHGGPVTEGEDAPIISPGLTSPTSQFVFTFNGPEYNAPDVDGEWISMGFDSGVEMMDEFSGVETIPRDTTDHGNGSATRRGMDLGLGSDINLENVFGVKRPDPLRILLANGVYYPNWHIYKGRSPSTLPLGMISHIFYSFAHVKEDGTVFLSDEWADLQIDVDGTKGCLNALKALKGSNPHLKTILSIGGGAASQNFAAVAADADKRAHFSRTAHALVVQHGLDGIDIDWEHPSNPTEGHHFLLLLQSIRQFLPEHTYILTAALPATEWHLQHIPLGQCVRYLNFLNVMAYDFFGSWSERAGHHSQLYPHPSEPHAPSCATAIDYLTNSPHAVPPHKILLGIPTYGRSFTGAHGPGMKFTGHEGDEGTFECCELPRPGAQVIKDRERGTVACVGEDGGYVGYEDGETVRGKGVWSRQRGLGGVFYWTGHGETGLVEAGFRGLHGG